MVGSTSHGVGITGISWLKPPVSTAVPKTAFAVAKSATTEPAAQPAVPKSSKGAAAQNRTIQL